ncbi:HPr kinase/phosphorylase [Sediminimonas qiaohouensis]|nr:HPr kinase/phosphatase C-terminal domain-containing protein [Sediminimonas qiaohouensis]
MSLAFLSDVAQQEAQATVMHASCVAVAGAAVLITGRSGAGKSGLALRLMAMGATLVSDDRTQLRTEGKDLLADVPAAIRGQIEARFVGILPARCAGPTPVRLLVDLDRVETERLPPDRSRVILGCTVPVLHNSTTDHFSAALMQYLKGAGGT